MSLTLAVDSSGRGGAVALARAGERLGVVRHDPAAGYAESLFGLIERALDEAGVAWEHVTALAAVRGPGSFTGLRIGIMTAKCLAYARDLELWTAPGFAVAAAALQAERPGSSWAVLQPAGRGAATLSVHRPGARASGPERLDAAELLDRLAVSADLEICVVGEDVDLALPPDRLVVHRPELASDLARFASRGAEPAARVHPAALVPYYVAPSQAERAHGLDLRDQVHRAIPPRSWPRD